MAARGFASKLHIDALRLIHSVFKPRVVKFGMPVYVFLVTLTEKGKSNLDLVKENSKELSELIKSLGGKSKEAFMTLGRYDIIEVIEFPSDLAALKYSMKSTESGLQNVETLTGFNSDEAQFSIK